MRIGLIADIHANLPALEAVLDQFRHENIDEIWNAGDLIGYGPFPQEVIRRIRDNKIQTILGNYDRKVLKFNNKSRKWKAKKHPLKLFAFEWASNQLTVDTRSYLRDLPEYLKLKSAGYQFLIVHGSPDSRSEHLTSRTQPERFKSLSMKSESDFIIFGHSHEPFAHLINRTWFINPGSVGRSDDGDYRASYAILEISENNTHIHHHRVDYDLNKVIDTMNEYNFPGQFIQMVKLGKNLDAIIAQK